MAREETRFDNHRLVGQTSLAQHLEESLLSAVDDRCPSFVLFLQLESQVFADQRPQLFNVDRRTIVDQTVLAQMEVAHAHLAKVAGMVFVHVGLQVMLTTGHTTTTGMFTVLADTTTAMADVAAQFTGLPQSSWLEWVGREEEETPN